MCMNKGIVHINRKAKGSIDDNEPRVEIERRDDEALQSCYIEPSFHRSRVRTIVDKGWDVVGGPTLLSTEDCGDQVLQ